ncbi:Glucosamine--fructose-6-phosphate aminotransferase (isomerizing) [Dissulfuribacter thermophilus]|uniref:Glutamine--fructose-6-phosphate aminotransferase [isomerizing] n=1 Tax=Dissulfuribacter thermophilus TaxID=1156395 RepID=A0A1B9F928_9BACT|nr:glutamine--fructose-6-phosphate transaminase (isomerizing) [Dissulfuribacter thermophilus]OCC16418.1 Glucosamine--fructose-6-phosphate aminotransferase (isomerizing) [Dissulfuribacter thermophilus]
MCGIVGYIGTRRCIPVLMEGLKRLEYRGYDSAGIAWLEDDEISLVKAKGKLLALDRKLDGVRDTKSFVGLGHTRWATHGEPSEDNAHPHMDCKRQLVVVHNGIIENYYSLKKQLEKEGHNFLSDTDTEVLAHLIEKYLNGDILAAVKRALQDVEGAYALGVLWKGQPDTIVAARKQSPLVLGITEDEAFMASDIPALLPYTNNLIFIDDYEVAVLKKGDLLIYDLREDKIVDKTPQEIKWDASMAEKAGYKHFMLKEIYEQPQAILNTLRGRVLPEEGEVIFEESGITQDLIKKTKMVNLVACGTSWHAGLVAKYWIEKWVRIPVQVDLASEFRYRDLLVDDSWLTIPISQSGETADTLAGLRIAKDHGSTVISICNVVGSTITRESDGTIYTHAGPEIGVASTKAFTSQLAALYLLGLFMAKARGTLDQKAIKEKIDVMLEVPGLIEEELKAWHNRAKDLSCEFSQYPNFLYLGRGLHFPVALEGALKLKEISYIHAEGYAAGEMKHGPIALIDKNMPVVCLAPQDHVYEKLLSNIEEVRSRRGIVISLGEKGDEKLKKLSKELIEVPKVDDRDVNPFLYTIPLQLLAYEIAVQRGCDVDQPRNLAKSVTVE